MKVAILANDDLTGSLIFSPILRLPHVEIAAVIFSESPMKGRKSMLAAALSLRKRMAFHYWLFLVITNGLFAVFSRIAVALFLHGSYGDLESLRAHARYNGIPVQASSDFNSSALKQLLRDLHVDLLLIRVSAILDAEVLGIPSKGTWCIHSSLLPAYGGIAGEFQAMRCGEAMLGSTVFEVTERLDEGPPLAQVAMPVQSDSSLFSHIVANNRAAGHLLAEMVADLADGNLPNRPLLNSGIKPSYYSWPKEEQVTEFRQKGWRLAFFREIFRLGLAALRLGRGFARFS
jgi:folate-dependent phosphoribosylglycinamide formyltransferase PurN